jgi:RND family efflux transporter MFP subunit
VPANEAATAAIQLGAENVAVVTSGTVQEGPVISGTLAPTRTAQIRAQVPGPVLATSADQGQTVAAGATLARIDATAIRDAYRSAQSAAGTAQLAADYAAANVRRFDTLLSAGAISDRDHEMVVEQNAQAQSALANAKAQLASASLELEATDVRAPFAGVIAARAVSAGDVVQPGMPMFTLVDPSAMQLEASVPAERIAAVHVGQPVTFSLNGYAGRTFDGRITRINPVADPSTRQVPVYARIPNVGRTLVGGLFATGRVVVASEHGLVAPSGVIDARNLRPSVLRVRQGRVERVDVVVGVRDDVADRVELTAGVAAGDTLLLGQAQALTPGTPVRVLPVPTGDSATAQR